MTGILIYNKDDYEKNSGYAHWILDEAKGRKMDIDLVFREDIRKKGISDSVVFAINRSRDYELSLLLEMNDIQVFNNSRVTLLGNNKIAGYHYAKELGLPVAPVFVSPPDKQKYISKPIFGHGGEGIIIRDYKDQDLSDQVNQAFIDDVIGDLRFYIFDNKIEHAVMRKAKEGELSNFSLGGDFEPYKYSEYEEMLTNCVLNDMQIDYAGLDFLILKNGQLIFNEIEDVVGSRMLSALGINNSVDKLLEIVGKKLKL